MLAERHGGKIINDLRKFVKISFKTRKADFGLFFESSLQLASFSYKILDGEDLRYLSTE